jgi:hypothetical protein
MAKTYSTAATAVRNYLSETTEGFWDDDEIYSYLTYATMEIWKHLILDDDNPYSRRVTHTLAGGGTGINLSDISGNSVYRIKNITSTGNKLIPRWTVIGGGASGSTGYISFSAQVDASSHNINIDYVGMPWNYTVQVESGNTSVEIDVPEVYFPWVIQRAAISALEKAGHDTQDLKAESNKILQGISMDMMFGIEREGMG